MEITKEFLIEEYIQKNKSALEISKELGYASAGTIHRKLDEYKIPKKNLKPSEILTRELLEDLYCIQRLSTTDIIKMLGIKSVSSIKDKVREYGLVRKRPDAKLRKTWTGYEEISGRYLQSIRNRCKQYNIENNYTEEYLWELFLKQNRKCVYCGEELIFAKIINNVGIKEQTASLDRIDSTKGYIIGNLQWVHKTINKMKQELDEQTFITFCKKVAQNI